MAKFKKGDRVRVISRDLPALLGQTGTILNVSSIPYIRMDKYCGGHTCDGLCDDGFGTAIIEKYLEHESDSPTNTITLILGNTAYEITGENITIKTKQL